MRLIFIAILVLALLYYVVWMPLRGRDKFDRVNKVMITVVMIPLSILSYGEFGWQQLDHQGTSIIRAVSHNDEGKLQCQRLSETFLDTRVTVLGYVMSNEPNKAVIKYSRCQELRDFFKHPAPENFDEFLAFQVLLHEAMHVGGEHNEAEAECKAIKSNLSVAKTLGKDMSVMEDYLDYYITNYYPRLPSEYNNNGCLTVPTK